MKFFKAFAAIILYFANDASAAAAAVEYMFRVFSVVDVLSFNFFLS